MDKQVEQQLTSKDFFFCYSPALAAHIERNGIKAITIAINPRNMNKFSQFANSERLTQLINEYKTTN